jgi:imidazolonepropionase-like amidohydrolase
MASSAFGADVVIQNAKILTITKGRMDGAILVRNGKIAEVAEKIMVPQGAQVIDAGGQFVMPGIIDCHSHIAAESINEGSVSVSSMVGIEDVLNPEDIAIYRALAGGVTTANILHGSANAIGGKCSVIKMRWGKDTGGVLFEGSKPGIKFALGENPKRRGGATTPGSNQPSPAARYPATRMGVEDVIREAFVEAKLYQAEWKGYEAKKARRERAAAAPRPQARAVGRGARKQAPRARTLLPRGRDSDADPARRRDGFQDPDLPARAGGVQGGQGDRRARGGRFDVQRLVGVQDRSVRRDSIQCRDYDAQGRHCVAQL